MVGRVKRIESVRVPAPHEKLCRKTRANLDNVIKDYLDKKHDFVALIVADKTGVGMGKSNLAHLLCAYVDMKIGLNRFSVMRVFFDGMDFRLEEKKLKILDSMNFDEPDMFLATEAMTKGVRKMKLKFTHIRQQRHFITICSPTMLLLTKWFRAGGESRVNVVIRIVRRGMFYVYSAKSGSMQKIRVDKTTNKIIYPRPDMIGFFKKIPEDSDWWKLYTDKKTRYLKHKDDNPKALNILRKERAKINNTLTIREIAEIHRVTYHTVNNWIREGYFGKRGVFIGYDGVKRVKMKAYNKGMKRVALSKEKMIRKKQKKRKKKVTKKRKPSSKKRKSTSKKTKKTKRKR